MGRLKSSSTMTCNGFRAGRVLIPAFDAHPAEMLKIVFPERHSAEMHLAEQALCREFSGNGRTSRVELAEPIAGWRQILHPQTAAEWLMATCGMSRQAAVGQLQGVGLPPDAALNGLAGNPRWLLGFLAAMQQSPAVLVFTTTGCDPMGVQRALETVRSRQKETIAIYLTCFTGLKIAEPPYAMVLEARPSEPVAA